LSYEEEYNPYENTGHYTYHTRKTKKKRTGLLLLLVSLALVTGIVSWAVNFMDLQVDLDKNNLTVSFGEDEGTDSHDPARKSEHIYLMEEEVPKTEDGLRIGQTPYSAENYPVADEQALSLQQIYEKVSPSVASISCITSGGSGSGTGIVMSSDGYIITNYHVVENAGQIYVLLGQNSQYPAELVGGDETTDLAVLKIEADNLQPAQFGDSDMLRVGDAVAAIGDPLGSQLRGTMTDGIISAINRDLNLSGRQMTLIQTNAALNSGNSGGPLINCYGQVVGINTMKLSSRPNQTAVEGLGFAIPIVQAKPILDELVKQGYVSGRPAIGIYGQNLDIRAQVFYRLPPGVIVTAIVEDSNAFDGGLKVNDVIVGFNDTPVVSLDDLVTVKGAYEAGDEVCLLIFRGGEYLELDIELMDQIKPDIY